MKNTEKILLDGYQGLCNCGTKLSLVNKIPVYWEYRKYNSDGVGACVCLPSEADFISLEYDRVGEIEVLPENRNHPSIKMILQDEEDMYR